MTPSVTVVMPVYNGLPYLREAVRSVVAQTHENWQLFIVDDASTDGSRKIIKQYNDPRIRKIYHHKNKGLYPTLIDSIKRVQTEWVTVLMQDDRLRSCYLKEMIGVVKENPHAQAIWGTENIIDKNGAVVREGVSTSRIEKINPGRCAWIDVLKRGCFWTISGSLTRKSLFQTIGFRGDFPHCGDYEWLLRAIRKTHFLYVDKPLIDLRMHPRQASADNLRKGVDIKERVIIVRNNFYNHASDLPRSDAFYICWRRVYFAFRRLAKALLNRRVGYALELAELCWEYLKLPFTYKSLQRSISQG